MRKIVNNLKQKTEQEKAALSVITAVIVTGLLFVSWGYNFANSGKINNLASSAASVAEGVESLQIKEGLDNALKQFDQIKNINNIPNNTDTEKSVGSQYINVFAN